MTLQPGSFILTVRFGGAPRPFHVCGENQNHTPETLERSLDSTLESVDSAFEELALSVAQRVGFDEDDLMKIGMAVRESMVNAVVHGNRHITPIKRCGSMCRHSPERFTIRIADEGEGFDEANVPDPLAPENSDAYFRAGYIPDPLVYG